MTSRFDLLVLGSGPAGSAAAVTAAGAGLSVALVDKSAFPRDKLCGGGLTGRSVRYLAEIFDHRPTPDLCLPSHQFRLSFNGRTLFETPDAPVLQMTMRRAFDAALHGEAKAAGVTVFAPVKVAQIETEPPRLTLADGRVIEGHVLIGADGANSSVARALFGRAYDPKEIGFGLEIELDRRASPEALNTPVTEIDLGAAHWGYGWVFPKHDTITVGVGGIHARNPDMKALFHRYLARHAPDAAHETLRYKGAFLPFGDYRKTPGRGAVLLAGDAAGLVDPITGEGIAWAMKSGQLAAEATVEALRRNRPVMAAYMDRVRYIHDELAAARKLRALIYAPVVRQYFPRAVERYPALADSYLRLLAGEKDYADLGQRAKGRLLWRMGSTLWRRAA